MCLNRAMSVSFPVKRNNRHHYVPVAFLHLPPYRKPATESRRTTRNIRNPQTTEPYTEDRRFYVAVAPLTRNAEGLFWRQQFDGFTRGAL